MLDLERMLDDFVNSAVIDSELTKGFARMRREMEVADLKEEYDQNYLLRTGLVTADEYATILASTRRAEERRRMQDTVYLMTQVVGQEEYINSQKI